MRRLVSGFLVAVAVTITGSSVAPAGAKTEASFPHVTVIADSVLAAVQANPEPLTILERGFDVTLDVGVCRRLAGTSCPDGAIVVPTAVDVIRSLGKAIGPTVVIEVGYSDFAETFSASVEEVIAALVDAGASHILWTNMSERRPQYAPMNQALAAAAGRHPQLRIVDWNAYSEGHASWFQPDDVHLEYGGAVGMATLLHASLEALLPPLVAEPGRLPVGRVGRPYTARLTASGGTPPYRWRVSRSLPGGLHLLADGRLTGIPRRPASLSLRFVATDVRGITATFVAAIAVQR